MLVGATLFTAKRTQDWCRQNLPSLWANGVYSPATAQTSIQSKSLVDCTGGSEFMAPSTNASM